MSLLRTQIGTNPLLFPNGRFALRWIRWLAVAQVIFWIVEIFIPSSARAPVQVLNFVLFLLLESSVLVVVIYRYRTAIQCD